MTKIEKNSFGFVDGEEVFLYTLSNSVSSAKITNYGATWVSFITPDVNGNNEDVLLGYDDVDGYLSNDGYFGSLVGRNANRIENAIFNLNNKTYKLHANDSKNNLHGGPKGFDEKIWTAQIIEDNGNEKLKLDIVSEDLDAGFPGELYVTVVYSLDADNKLSIEYSANSNVDTVVNLTNHAYFNLKGQGNGTITDHLLKINSDYYTDISPENLCPTGEILKVSDTPLDFNESREIGKYDFAENEFLVQTNGYDHNFVLKTKEKQITLAANVLESSSKRVMNVYTNKPGVQLYTGNMITKRVGKLGKAYEAHSGFCLETQYFPNAINIPHFPSPILKAGERYSYTTVYEFSVNKN